MVVFPTAKLNLGLNILRKRSDGYHDLQTCFYLLPWHDVLEVIPSTYTSLSITGAVLPGPATHNHVVRAWKLLHSRHGIDCCEFYLHKAVPTGGGLGGGSADAAYALKALNSLFELQLSTAHLQAYAAELGSDCPFFVTEQPALATGRGEVLEPLDLSLKGTWCLAIWPGYGLSTAQAYARVVPKEAPALGPLLGSKAMWQQYLANDFEAALFPLHPELARLKQALIDAGAWYAAMSGSGSTVFGLFEQEPDSNLFNRAGYALHCCQLS